MSENREEILANFQGITAIDNVAEAIYHLEESNWDLFSAINRVMPQDSVAAPTDQHHDVEMIDQDISIITPKILPPDKAESAASTSSRSINAAPPLNLHVHYESKMHDVSIPPTATVMDLKKRIELMTGVPLCRQQLSGLGGSRATSAATLGSLGLDSGAALRLKAADGSVLDDEAAERLTSTYTLRVKSGERDYMLKYPGTKTVQEVKSDVYSLTDIPVRHQRWAGWPEVTGLDATVLALAGLTLPVHELSVERAREEAERCAETNARPSRSMPIVVESSDSESSLEELEDAVETFPNEDDMFVDVQREPVQPLMSESIEDEAIGCIEFAARFKSRYGPHTPNFFEGRLHDAIEESCMKPANERRLLGVYLHHERSVLSNVFCAQLLGCDAVMQTLEENFLLYGWDLTLPSNCDLLLNSVANTLGPVASMTVRSIPVERLPALLIIMRVRSNTEIYTVINGNVGVSELVGSLVEAVERFGAARAEDARAELEREARQRVKREQDEAYQRSLEADRLKEETRKQQEMERNQELEKVESERLRDEAKKEKLRSSAEKRVPSEPPEESPTSDVAHIRVRLPPPHSGFLTRRFYAHNTVCALLDYLASQGYPRESYKVITSWPRRDLTAVDEGSTLKELKLFPQETVVLEER